MSRKPITFFDARLSKMGGRVVIFVPQAILPQIAEHAGKKVRVTLSEIEEKK